MKNRLATASIFLGILIFLTFIGLTPFQKSSARAASPLEMSTKLFEKPTTTVQNWRLPESGNVALETETTITATDRITRYVFLPLIEGPPAVPEFVTRVMDETNSYRSRYGCPPLALKEQLTDAAQVHSEDMAFNDFFSHTGSDGSSPWERIVWTGYRYSLAAENIAAGYLTPEGVVEGWMSSDGHRENILDCKLREVGVGYYCLENDRGTVNYHHYWTLVLATPR